MAGADSYKEAKAKMEEHIQLVAREIGRDWRRLGRKLTFGNQSNDAVIQCIDEEYKSSEEKAYQVLVRWYQANGRAGATKDVLYKALRAIGRKSVAESIEHECRNATQDKRSEQPTNPEDQRSTSPSPIHTKHSLKKFDRTLNEMYDTCIDNLTPATDYSSLVDKLKMTKYTLDCNAFLEEFTTHSHSNDDEIKSLKTTCKIRRKQAEQTMKLILQTMSAGKPREDRTRPLSEMIPRCTSIVKLQPRSGTFGPGSISSPFLLPTESRGSSPIHDRIHEEALVTEEPEEGLEFSPLCSNCGSCINVQEEKRASENQEISLGDNCNQTSEPDPVPDEITADNVKERIIYL